jgi:hypothetical protein
LWIAEAATSAAAIAAVTLAALGDRLRLATAVSTNSRFAARLAAAFFFAANGTSGLSGGNVGSRATVAPRHRQGSGSFPAATGSQPHRSWVEPGEAY